MKDLTQAINCIRAMKENGTYKGHRIGRIKKAIYGETSMISEVPYYNEGEIVLFREELSSDFKDTREYSGMEQQLTGSVTIESPLTQEEIVKQRGNFLLTGTIIGVPKEHVEEIRI